MNNPISFELAKLLKEKGFDIPLGIQQQMDHYDEDGDFCRFPTGLELYYVAPTIAEVVMWLYEKHGIWICVRYLHKYKEWDYVYSNIKWTDEEYSKHLQKDIDEILEGIFNRKPKFNSPTEAYEAAIKYTLKNLISDGKIRVNQSN